MPQGHPSHNADVRGGAISAQPSDINTCLGGSPNQSLVLQEPCCFRATDPGVSPPTARAAVQARIPPWPVHKSHCIISFPHYAVPHETLESPVLPRFNVPTFFCLSFSFASLPPLTCFCLWCQGSLCIWCHLRSSMPCSSISEPDMGHLWSGLYCLLPRHPHPQPLPPG